jgi:hypothetical protein
VTGTCSHEDCYAPHVMCVFGRSLCPNMSSGDDASGAEAQEPGNRLPWSGLALGQSDLAAIVASGRVRLVALVGTAGAGKTSALAAHWLGARRGDNRYGRQFAGSFTLSGWHQIARHLEWGSDNRGFPPHTTASNNRVPALLHEALLYKGKIHHLLFADVPGEWYRAWAYDAEAVPGAQWIAQHADSFVLLADSEVLSGEQRGEARGNYEALAHRLASAAGDRPVVPVRTKADVDIPAPMLTYITRVNDDLFGRGTIEVSVQDRAAPLTEVAAAGIDVLWSTSRSLAAPDAPSGADGRDAFLRFRSVAVAT